MPLQNRVLPTGEIIIDPARGTLTGNRGIIHREDQTLGTSRWSHHAWICCTLDWKGRKRPLMTGRNWTELFFLDEAVAFAAGHRPCGYCRRQAYGAFVAAWTDADGPRPKAPQMDQALHAARIMRGSRAQRRSQIDIATLPAGAMILYNDQPHLVSQAGLHPFAPSGYAPGVARPRTGVVTVLTPAPTIAVLRAGYCPLIHPSAGL